MAIYNWRVTGGDFGLAADWTVNGVTATVAPGTSDSTSFGTGATGTITGTGSVASISFNNPTNVWTIGGQITAVQTFGSSGFAIAPGGKLTLTGVPNSNGTSANFSGNLGGTVTVNGGTLDSSTGTLTVGSSSNVAAPTGTLTVQGAGMVNAINLGVGQGSTGTVNVTGAGSTLKVLTSPSLSYLSFLSIGQNTTSGSTVTNGTGHLVVSSGGAVQADSGFSVGADAGSTGDAAFSGASTLTAKNGTTIGQSGTGTMSVSGGSTVTTATNGASRPDGATNYDIVGSNVGGVGNLTIDGAGSKWTSGNQFIVANFGTGTATLTNSAALTAVNGLAVGQLAGSVGTLTLSSGSTASSGGTITVGNTSGSQGNVTVNAGSKLLGTAAAQTASYLLRIGLNAASGGQTAAYGVVNVTGAGALLDMGSNGAQIGGSGNGTLNISAGGAAKFTTTSVAAISSLALGASGTGVVNVDGAGSTLSLVGGFYAGRASGSSGTINVTNGGSLVESRSDASGNAIFGTSTTSGSTVVSGGTGTLTIASGGTATIADSLTFGNNGSTGTGSVTGGTMSVGGVLTIGTGTAATGANGTLTVSGGSVVRLTAASDTTRSYLVLGGAAATTGTVVVDGQGSLVDAGANGAGIGTAGTGSLTVSGGASAKSATSDGTQQVALGLANVTGSSGTLTVTGTGSSYDANGFAYVGRGGTGRLVVDQGGTFTGGSAPVGAGTGANAGFAIVIGDGSPSTVATPYYQGTGTAQVLNGSTLHSRNALYVGNRGGTGTLLLDGGSTVLADTLIQIGTGTDRTGASGTVTVQGGSTLRSGGVHALANAGISIGVQTGTLGSVTVTGANSLMDANGDRVTVGSRASGNLTIAAGGKVLAGANYADTEAALSVGSSAGSTGTISISGTGSQLLASGLAVLGGNNTGGGVTAGGTANISVNGGLFRATSLAMFGTSVLNVGSGGTAVIGSSAGTVGAITVDAGSSITGAGLLTTVIDNGTVTAQGGSLSVLADGRSTGVFGASNGTLNVTFASSIGRLAFSGNAATINVNGFSSGSSTITGFTTGDVLDIKGTVSVSGNTITFQTPGSMTQASYVFTDLVAGATLGLESDGSNGTKIVTSADPLFDSAYYLAQNQDVAAAGVDPYQHYITTGWKEGRNPSALFNTNYYLSQNPDIAAAGVNPLLHFEASGWKEGRDPSASFSVRDYLAANQDVKAAGIDPLLHYVQSGKAEGRAAFAVSNVAPDPLVDAVYYYAHNPDVKAAGVDATAHYLASGWKEGRNPDAFFDTNYYLTQNPDVRAAGVDPLLHFEASGWKEGRQPSLVFDDAKYLQANPDVAAAGLDPLQHYLSSGMAEGRAAYLTGGTAAADPLVNTAYYDAQLGATIIPAGTPGAQQAAWSYDATGWQKGLNPDAFFDTNYYLSHNPDVAAAHIDPLLHYENNGWHEGRDPSAQFSTNKYLAAYSDVRNAGIDPLLHYVVNGQAEGRTAFAV